MTQRTPLRRCKDGGVNRGILLTVLSAALFGIAGVVAADAFSEVEPVVVAQYRSVIAAVLLGVVARRRGLRPGGQLRWLVVFGSMIAGVTIAFYWSIDRLGVGPGVTIQFVAAVPVLAWMRYVQKRQVRSTAWVAAGLAIIGTVLMMRAWDLTALDPFGLGAALVSMGLFGGYLLVGEKLREALPALTVVANGFLISALIWLIALPPRLIDVEPLVWGQIIWVGVMGTAVPFLIMVTALGRADSGTIGVVAMLEPVVATVAAWIYLDQRLEAIQIVGGLLVVAAIASIHLTIALKVPAQL